MTHIIYHPIITVQGKEVRLVFRNIILDDMAINVKMMPTGSYIRCHQSIERDIYSLDYAMEMLDELDDGEVNP